MRLYLARHADAEEGADDAARRLSARGRAHMRAVAKLLAAQKPMVAAIWHSGLVRAGESAGILAAAVTSAGKIVQKEGLGPMDKPGRITRAMGDVAGDLMIVGHEPHLGRLASKLLTGRASADVVHVRKAAVLCLGCDDAGKWRIEWMITPELAGQVNSGQRGNRG